MLKRVVESDPSGQGGQFSYAYAGDNPIDASDPTGLSCALAVSDPGWSACEQASQNADVAWDLMVRQTYANNPYYAGWVEAAQRNLGITASAAESGNTLALSAIQSVMVAPAGTTAPTDECEEGECDEGEDPGSQTGQGPAARAARWLEGQEPTRADGPISAGEVEMEYGHILEDHRWYNPTGGQLSDAQFLADHYNDHALLEQTLPQYVDAAESFYRDGEWLTETGYWSQIRLEDYNKTEKLAWEFHGAVGGIWFNGVPVSFWNQRISS